MCRPKLFAIFVACLMSCASAPAQLETRTSFSTGSPYAFSLIAGDFNRDGLVDVAEVNDGSPGSIGILLGNGDGTFRRGSTYTVAEFPWYAATGSLRRNGILDLVVSDKLSDSAWVMLGNGDGTFQPPVAYPTSAESYTIGLGHFTTSGNLDIVALGGTNTRGESCSCIEVLPGNGDGTFQSPITATLPYDLTAYTLATGDFNNDGKLDVAVGGEGFPNYMVAILLGNGDGTFTPAGNYPLGADPVAIATGNFTANKKNIDLAISDYNGVDVLLGNGDGTFQQPVFYLTGFLNWVVAADFSGGGKTDLAVTNIAPSGVSVLKGNGDGTFQSGVFYPAGREAGYIVAADLNGDRKPDLALVDRGSSSIFTLLNTGVVSFSPTTPLNFKNQTVGTTSAAQTVTLTNTGTTALNIASMKASPQFAVTSTCGSNVASGASCTISATFSPTKKGAAQGTISIVDSASTKPMVIELLGTGT